MIDFGEPISGAMGSAGGTCAPSLFLTEIDHTAAECATCGVLEGLRHCGFNCGRSSCQEHLASRSVRDEWFQVCAFCLDAYPQQLKKAMPPASPSALPCEARKRTRSPFPQET
eukprot:2340910-Amphidinium_carterae.2